MSDCIQRTTFTHKGVTFYLSIHPDYDSRPDEFEGYSSEDHAAWKRDEWRYVGVIVSIRPDDTGPDFSLWGIEYGQLTEIPYIDVASLVQRAKDEEWCDEAVRAARADIKMLHETLQAYEGPST